MAAWERGGSLWVRMPLIRAASWSYVRRSFGHCGFCFTGAAADQCMVAMQRCLSVNVGCRDREDALAMRASGLGEMLCLTAAPVCAHWTHAAHSVNRRTYMHITIISGCSIPNDLYLVVSVAYGTVTSPRKVDHRLSRMM